MEGLTSSPSAIQQDASAKREKVRAFLKRRDLDGVVISTREHFAWLTSGGDSHVVRNSSIGFGSLVITPERHYLVAHSMDAERLLCEQTDGQGYELVSMRWHEGDMRAKAVELAGERVGSDTDFPGCVSVYADLVDMHYPMSEFEMSRLRWLAGEADRIFCEIARQVQPEQTERQIATLLHSAHLQAGMEVDVLIVGSDERCFQYRHPLPTEKPLEKYLMLHTVARRWGLHCNLTRFVHFGQPGENIQRVYDVAAQVVARVILSLKPGLRFADILEWQKQWYAEQGFAEEWRNHFQGGPTGYVIVDAGRCLTKKVVQENMPFEWFITVTGTKMGELVMLTPDGVEITSLLNSTWPVKTTVTPLGEIALTDILVR